MTRYTIISVFGSFFVKIIVTEIYNYLYVVLTYQTRIRKLNLNDNELSEK